MEVLAMECTSKVDEMLVFYISDRVIELSKELVDKYSDIVCPVTEKFLTGMINAFGKDCKDNVLSYRIALDMAQELDEYKL